MHVINRCSYHALLIFYSAMLEWNVQNYVMTTDDDDDDDDADDDDNNKLSSLFTPTTVARERCLAASVILSVCLSAR